MAKSPSSATSRGARRTRCSPGSCPPPPLAQHPPVPPASALGPTRPTPAPRGFAAPVAHTHRARPRRPPRRQGHLVRAGPRLQLAGSDACCGQRQGRCPAAVPLPAAPTAGHRVGSRPALPAANHRGKVWKPSLGFHVDDRLCLLPDGAVRLDFKRPWSDGTSSVELEPLALIARLAALVPPPKRHTVRYFGVLSSHANLRSQVVPAPASPPPADKTDQPPGRSRYIPWAELLRRTFGIDVVCAKCQAPPRLIALIKTEAIAKKILTAVRLVPSGPRACPPCPCPTRLRRARRPPKRPSFTPHARRPASRSTATTG